MGIRSFIIKFNSIDDIKIYFKWRKYLAQLVCEHYDEYWDLEQYYEIIDRGLPKKEELDKLENKDNGDFDLHLVGLKFWAGAIWGLISTYSVGEVTFDLLRKISNTYYSRLSVIDMNKTDYNDCENMIMRDYYENPSQVKTIKLYNDLVSKNEDKLLDYDTIVQNNQLNIDIDKDKFLGFTTKKMFKLFNIKYKK